jgi:hypothetical protein
MRDSQILEDIFDLIRKLWLHWDVSVGKLVHSAADPESPNEISTIPDFYLKKLLQEKVAGKTNRSKFAIIRQVGIWSENFCLGGFKTVPRDPQLLEEIFQLIRKLHLINDSSVAQVIYSAVDPLVSNEIKSTSDGYLRKMLQASVYYRILSKNDNGEVISEEHLAALDEAWHYGTASSFNWLNSEVRKMRQRISQGEGIKILDGNATLIINDLQTFNDWVQTRFTGVKISE